MFILAGDYRQILPVMQTITNKAAIIENTIKHSYLWNYFTIQSEKATW